MNTAKPTDPIWDSRNSDEPGDAISGQQRSDRRKETMHYKNGREAKPGDPVINLTYGFSGILGYPA